MTEQESVIRVSSGDLEYEFSGDGFLCSIHLQGAGAEGEGRLELTGGEFGRLHITLSDGRVLTPFVPESSPPRRGRFQTADLVLFDSILWKDAEGAVIPDFRLSLRYEFWEGGRGFVDAFFWGGGLNAPALDEFSLKFHLALSFFPELNWACLPRPRTVDGSLIQSFGAGRYLERGKEIRAEHLIVPAVNFNARHPSATAPSAYFEILVEGQNSPDESADNNFTDLKWTKDGDFSGEWGFILERPARCRFLHVFQWRNRWGWVLKRADATRRKPPFHMYHYFDNEKHYPSTESIEAMAAAGTDVLAIHECWRYDLQNGGFPYDTAELVRVVEEAHRHGIRILLYMRGNESSATESACQWFDLFLRKNYDGLYMDYGGPFHAPLTDESYPGGRIQFRDYFLQMKALRDRVGEDGLFLAHTGSSFSAIGFAGEVVDGYVSGEGESGVMVDGRREHEYFSMAPVCPGTMWTGAFPAYSTSRMRPFLAATGQYPHNPLGIQFPSSSLSHPSDPGLNDTAFKPLWKLWRFFRNERNIRIFNDYNSAGIFSSSRGVGHYLMISEDSRRALLILCNFENAENEISCTVNWEKTSFLVHEMSCAWKLQPTESSPGKAELCSSLTEPFRFMLGAYDVCGVFLLCSSSSSGDGFPGEDSGGGASAEEREKKAAELEIADFEKPYPDLSEANRLWLERVARQREMRSFAPRAAAEKEEGRDGMGKKAYLRISVPPSELPYEFSLIYDLYLNSMELVEFKADGAVRRVGWITKKGLVHELPTPEEYVWPSEESPWIPLHEIFPSGEHHLGVRSLHYGKPFYSFIYADLSENADGSGARRLEFLNELEEDRRYLRWTLFL